MMYRIIGRDARKAQRSEENAPVSRSATQSADAMAHPANAGHSFAAVSAGFRAAPVAPQARLEIGPVNDPLEQEADATASRVMRHAAVPAPAAAQSAPSAPPTPGGGSHAPGNAEPTGDAVEPLVRSATRSGGQTLDAETREFMEGRFGHDFSQVRVHTGHQANDSARQMQAQAFTFQNDIVFGAGHYAPGTEQGRWLLAHELTHVAQQGAAPRKRSDAAAQTED